jgi:hypothetical protein
MKTFIRQLVFVLLCAAAGIAAAQAHHDPLTQAESDQIRETAQQPNDRLKLFVTFARSRMLAVDHLQADPRFAAGRGTAIHNLVDDFRQIMDELDDNIDQYATRHDDMRKGLAEVVEATSDFQLRLRALKEMEPSNDGLRKEKQQYALVVQDAIDSNNDVADNARKTLDEQNEFFKKKKDEKKPPKSDKDP